MSLAETLQQGAAQLKLGLGEEERRKLLDYLALLEKWNKVYNLTAIRDPRQMVSNHILDSLTVLPHLWPKRWLDVGSGAGLPGIVLAIMRPDWSFVLLDSNSKKTSFIQQATIELGLKNVSVQCGRVEKWHPADLFDGVISRAFSDIGKFVGCTRHLVAPYGRWAAMKAAWGQELEPVSDGCRIESVIPLQVPGLQATRSLVIVRCEGS